DDQDRPGILSFASFGESTEAHRDVRHRELPGILRRVSGAKPRRPCMDLCLMGGCDAARAYQRVPGLPEGAARHGRTAGGRVNWRCDYEYAMSDARVHAKFWILRLGEWSIAGVLSCEMDEWRELFKVLNKGGVELNNVGASL